MPNIKELELLISPFSLVPLDSSNRELVKSKEHRSFQMCKCDSDEENDFGMAPECMFHCTSVESFGLRNKTTKKHKPVSRTKKTKKTKKTRNSSYHK